jgi:hypothetical protein
MLFKNSLNESRPDTIWRDRDFWVWGVFVPLGAALAMLGQILLMARRS